MTATTEWRNGNPTILTHTFIGKWSTSEVETELLEATPEIESRSEKVVVIIDLLQYTMPTPDVNILATIRRFTQKRPANISMIIVVSHHPLVYSLLNVVRRILPKTNIIFTAKSMDEALALIPKHTETR